MHQPNFFWFLERARFPYFDEKKENSVVSTEDPSTWYERGSVFLENLKECFKLWKKNRNFFSFVWILIFVCFFTSSLDDLNTFIWNRQRKRSFRACGAAVKLHVIVPWRAAEKSPKRGSASGPRGATSPPNRPPGPSPLDPFPSFGNVKFVTIKMWYYPACARTQ